MSVSNAGRTTSDTRPGAGTGVLPLRAALFQEQDAYGLIVTDGNDMITDWNPAATRMYGYSREEAIGQKTTLIRVPENTPRLPSEIIAAMARDGRWSGEIAFKHKNGTVGISDTVIFAFLDENGDRATIDINRDISEQKRVQKLERENEARLRLITDNVAANITYLDNKQRFRFLNKNMADVLGLSPDDVLGKSAHEIQGEEMYRQVVPHIERALGGEEVTFERNRVRADGITRTYQSTYLPHFDERGEVLGIYGLSIDITEPKRAEAIAHAAREEAEQANRAKSEFLANMSHELRTPLNAINGFSEMIFAETLGPLGNVEYQKYAGYIKEAGQHLLALINDLLDISKIEAGSVELAKETIDVAALVRSCVTMICERADAIDVRINVDIDEELLPLLCADETRIRQVVLNLLSNAVKFTQANGVVTVRVWYHVDRGFVLQVADTGIGIAAENIPRALARFEQVESTLDRTYAGTGLGLPLTKSLVEQHGGTLDLHSEVGVGTVVTVSLPADCAIRQAA